MTDTIGGAAHVRFKAKQFVQSLPGKRGTDIPTDLYDRIFNAASGVTQQIWGRHPTPEQMQWLHDNGHHTPDVIHDQIGKLPHPHADGITVSEYPKYLDAFETYKKNR